MMNEKVAELGGTNSHFVNANGLHNDEHYTSAHDMALIGAAAFKYEEFRKITGTRQYTIGPTALTSESRTFQQNHKMLFQGNRNYYEYCVGGKTGYTKVPVTKEQVTDKNIKSVDENAYVMLPSGVTFDKLDATLQEPTELGDKSGTLIYTYQGQEVGKVPVTITDKYYNKIHGIEEKKTAKAEKKETKKEEGLPTVVVVLLVILGIVILFAFALILLLAYKRKKIKERRKRARMRHQRQQRMKRE